MPNNNIHTENKKADITICTVSYESLDWLRLNFRLVKRMNPHTSYTWCIVENSDMDSPKRIRTGTDNMNILKGPVFRERGYGSACYHHGEGLNLGVSKVETRFLLVLDPDFYIVMDNWIEEVLSYMDKEGVGILGVPWHPRRYKKWRYFPAVHCTFFDLSRVDKDALDFRPDFETYPPIYAHKEFSWIRKRLKRFDPLKMHRRRYIGSSADTGFRVYRRFYHDHGIRTECFAGVYCPSILTRSRDLFFPDRASLLPKRANYYSKKSFADFGLPDFNALGCEEFMWKERPFGFHVHLFQIQKHSTTVVDEIQDEIAKLVDSYTG